MSMPPREVWRPQIRPGVFQFQGLLDNGLSLAQSKNASVGKATYCLIVALCSIYYAKLPSLSHPCPEVTSSLLEEKPLLCVDYTRLVKLQFSPTSCRMAVWAVIVAPGTKVQSDVSHRILEGFQE